MRGVEIFGGCGWKAVAEFIGEIKDWSRVWTGFMRDRIWQSFLLRNFGGPIVSFVL